MKLTRIALQLVMATAVVATVFTLVGLAGGCAALPANPRTEIGTWSWKFHNSKDVSIELDEASYNPQTKEGKLKGLQIIDNASDVREANVQQMVAMAEQIRAQGEAWDRIMARANEALIGVLDVLPGLYATRAQIEADRLEARFKRLEALLERLELMSVPIPVTDPIPGPPAP